VRKLGFKLERHDDATLTRASLDLTRGDIR
jgi:hypothetical protein